MTLFRKLKNETILVLLIGMVCSASILCFCSKNSWLYIFNDWVDANAFFTMGKGMMNNLVPYKDLFEQKGPLLYFIYGLGYLIQNDNLHGVFVIEILMMTIAFYYLYKIANLYCKKIYSILIATIMILLIGINTSFVQGGSAEELCLPFFVYSMYHFLNITKESVDSKKNLIINGFIAGCIALVKFNLLGYWFAWMALVFFRLIFQKKVKEAFKACIYFLIGMFVPIAIFCIYFALNDGLEDFISVYIVFNLTSYTTTYTLAERISNMINSINMQIHYSRMVYALNIASFIWILIKFKKEGWNSIFIVSSYVLLMLGVYFGGNAYIYYYLDFIIYSIFGLILLFEIYELINNNVKITFAEYIPIILTVFLCMWYLPKSNNLKDINKDKDSYAQFSFLNIINNSDDKSILNYDNLDGGFYTTLNQVPSVKYFMRQNVDYERYPEIMDSQNKYISDKKTEFVIIREFFGNWGLHEQLDVLNENYNLVAVKEQIYESMDYKYYLYQRKE